MKRIITLTVNPAIDKSTTVASIKPHSKLRCTAPVYEAGGGGINVSKVLKELGSSSLCMYMAGGPTGIHLKELIDSTAIAQHIIPIKGWVRENLAVTDTSNNQQYRFGMPGPSITENEWKNTLRDLESELSAGDFVVASGSLCPGMPIDFYAKVAHVVAKKKGKLILDTSGEALIEGAKAKVYLLKPNLNELATLCNVTSITYLELETYAKEFLKNNSCEILIVSLGAQGALLVTKDIFAKIPAPVVHQKSTIGAGDSMVAGMVFGLSQEKSFTEMAQFGIACGTAATMTEGTQLCKKKDVDKLYKWILSNTLT
ncbi:1-phosphofructokinase family hexose kinase [Maribacter sp. CXY002]|uniref:1-phosphofructokinase family hexose kinase n=1 Tax=Maribacter luteocoastalis TaxID=3407671 RepID=UPI003B6859B1